MKRYLPPTITILLLIFILIAGSATSYAQSNITDDQVNEVAGEMFCPTCENTPLDVCPTQTCADWRELIRQQLGAGKSKSEIHLYFADQFGDHVLANPPRRGFDWLIWLLPVLFVVVGGLAIFRYMSGIRIAEPVASMPASPPPAPQNDTYTDQIEQELRNRT